MSLSLKIKGRETQEEKHERN